jgi:hypothetical protein
MIPGSKLCALCGKVQKKLGVKHVHVKRGTPVIRDQLTAKEQKARMNGIRKKREDEKKGEA